MVPKLHAHALGEQNPHALGISPFAKPGASPGFEVCVCVCVFFFFFFWGGGGGGGRVPLRVPFKGPTRGFRGLGLQGFRAVGWKVFLLYLTGPPKTLHE